MTTRFLRLFPEYTCRMPVNWIDVTPLSFNTLLLLERVQLSWFPGWLPEAPLAIALRANPDVEWYLRHKCPQITPWLDRLLAENSSAPISPQEVRAAEVAILNSLNDLITYAVDPSIYDRLSFTAWDDHELLDLVDFRGQVVLDIGAGPGRLALVAAEAGAAAVYAVEPVENLRRYLLEKARARGLNNLYAVDGLLTAIPFAGGFAGVVMGGHVFGDDPAAEVAELERVTRPGGTVILMPGNNDVDNDQHSFLLAHGFNWARFPEPPDMVRKYWKTLV